MTKVLLLYEEFIPSVRLCAYEQLNYLSNEGLIELTHCKNKELKREQCEVADVVFFVRAATSFDYLLVKQLKKMNKYLVYVLDDDILHIEPNLSTSPFYQMNIVKNRIRNILKLCDVLASPSNYLLNKYSKYVNKVAKIEEPCLYIDKYENINKKIKIGYAGSNDRNKDIKNILENVIEKLILKHSDKVEFEFFGAKPEFVDRLNINYYKFEDNYEKYQDKLISLNWDIGLSPMSSSEFKMCKHYNKYLEYGSINCVGIYSNVTPYKEIIRTGENGILCDNFEDEWFLKIESLILDTETLDKIKSKINQEMNEKFSPKKVSMDYFFNIPELKFYASNWDKYNTFELHKIYAYIIRIYEFIIRNGWRAPFKAVVKFLKL